MNIALIFAGGVGSRMGDISNIPKQFIKVKGKSIIIRTIENFENHSSIDAILVVCKSDWIDYLRNLLIKYDLKKIIDIITGGSTGTLSIRNGIYYLNKKFDKKDIVLINDGVRPFITFDLIESNINMVKNNGNAISAVSCIETIGVIKRSEHLVSNIIDRNNCVLIKAPQSFYLGDIYDLHVKAEREGKNDIIDSATLFFNYGYKLNYVESSLKNIKVTTAQDLFLCEQFIKE